MKNRIVALKAVLLEASRRLICTFPRSGQAIAHQAKIALEVYHIATSPEHTLAVTELVLELALVWYGQRTGRRQ